LAARDKCMSWPRVFGTNAQVFIDDDCDVRCADGGILRAVPSRSDRPCQNLVSDEGITRLGEMEKKLESIWES